MTINHPHRAVIERFYDAFSRRDAAGMAACYHPSVHFSDPAFPDLHGFRAGAMWQMLCARGKDLVIAYSNVTATPTEGAAHWDATYTFSATKRKVVNRIDAAFEFRDGLIVRHVDTFDFWKWSKQALGAPGLLLGWTPFLKKKVQGQASKGLDLYIAKNGLSSEKPILG
jgi:ketosteroid isomerase-like protein